MLRSIYVRFILANVLVVIASVALTAALAGRMTSNEFRQFTERGDISRSNRLTRVLAETYTQSGNWANAQSSVERLSQITGERVALADNSGKIIADSGQTLLGQTVAPHRLSPFGRIVVGGNTVGHLVTDPDRVFRSQGGGSAPPTPVSDIPPAGPVVVYAPPSSSFADAIYRLTAFSAGIAAVIAIVVTLVLSRRMLHPVTALTDAARRMEAGDLGVRVKAETNDEIGSLAHAFNAMADSLARNEQLRRNMVNDVAHELRTPLTNLRGYLEAAREGMVQPDQQYIESLYEETMLLNRLTDDLQELALAEAGQLRLSRQPVNMADLVHTSLEAVRLQAETHGLSLRVAAPDDLPLVDADPLRVAQVLRNLVSNALEFTPPGGEIAVSVASDGKDVRVEVRDTGPGIAPEHVPFVFERFYRVDPSRSRSTGGAGLGLTIVKNLVEAHGGRVWVQSTPGVGSTFGFSLPALRTNEALST